MTNEEIIGAMKTYFLHRVEEDCKEFRKIDYHYKWVGTWKLAELLGVNISIMRNRLNKMQKQGLVECQRRPNYLLWATKIDGFEQHLYKDYYYRTQTNTNENSKP